MLLRFRLLIVALMVSLGASAEWQWCVDVDGIKSGETGKAPEAFMWIPAETDSVRAVMFGIQNMNEETIFEMPSFRARMADMGVALVWFAPGFGQEWDVTTGVQQAFDSTLVKLAEVSGYDEIAIAPIIPFGHSAQATMPWNFAAWNPDRTLCIISYHGDSPRTNLCGYGRANLEWGRTRNIDGIPGIMLEGEYEWWDARVWPSLAFRMMYPGSCISFLGDAGRGHFDVAEKTADYIADFIAKSMEYRPGMKRLNPQDGWLAERWYPSQTRRAKPAPFAAYKGDPHEAFWYFDEEMARKAEARYDETRGKQPSFIGFERGGEPVKYDVNSHIKMSVPFTPEADGVTMHIRPFVATDSTRAEVVNGAGQPRLSRVCGSVKVVNDSTIRLDFFRIGMENARRSWEMVLVADYPSTRTHKEAVQELQIRVPAKIANGRRQSILFPSIQDVERDNLAPIRLGATSDAGLPVYYYVKQGPAEIDGDMLHFTDIPPRAKLPMKVTVVAWQFGIDGEVNTAAPVEQTFYIK